MLLLRAWLYSEEDCSGLRARLREGRAALRFSPKTHGRLDFTHTVASLGRWSQLTKCEALQPLHILVSALPCLVSVVQLSQNTPPHLRQWCRRSVSPKSPAQTPRGDVRMHTRAPCMAGRPERHRASGRGEAAKLTRAERAEGLSLVELPATRLRSAKVADLPALRAACTFYWGAVGHTSPADARPTASTAQEPNMK
jgi:hypothetical protein